MSHDIVGAVVAGRADVGVVALESEHPALRFAPYKEDQLVLLAPITHELAKQSHVSFASMREGSCRNCRAPRCAESSANSSAFASETERITPFIAVSTPSG